MKPSTCRFQNRSTYRSRSCNHMRITRCPDTGKRSVRHCRGARARRESLSMHNVQSAGRRAVDAERSFTSDERVTNTIHESVITIFVWKYLMALVKFADFCSWNRKRVGTDDPRVMKYHLQSGGNGQGSCGLQEDSCPRSRILPRCLD